MKPFAWLREAFGGLRELGRLSSEAKGYGGGGGNSLLPLWEKALDLAGSVDELGITRPVQQHPTVNRAVRIIASSVAEIDVEVVEGPKSKAVAVEDHWLPALLQAPAESVQGDTFVETAQMFLESRGECFIQHRDVFRDSGGPGQRPHELWILWPECMTPLPAGAQRLEQVRGWRYAGFEGTWTMAPEELTFLRYPNPHDLVRGMNPLMSTILEVDADHRMAVYNQAFYRNSAIPSIIFSSKAAWPEDERKRFIAGWELKLKGARRTGLATALPDKVEATIVKMTQQEMAFLEARRFSREQILSVYGVPPAIAGIFEFANYANSREQEAFYVTKTILPKVRYLESALTAGLLARYEPDRRVHFMTEKMVAEVLAEKFAAKVTVAKELFGMGFPPEAINERLGLGMETDGMPWLGEGWLPFSVVPASSLMGDGEGDDEEDEVEEGEEVEPPAPEAGRSWLPSKGAGLLLPKATVKEADRDSRWTGLSNLWGSIGRGLHRRLRTWLWGLRGEVLAKLAKAGGSRSMVRAVGPEDVNGLLFDAEKAAGKLKEVSETAWRQAMARGASALKGETGLEFDFSFLDPRVLGFLADKAVKIVRVSDGVRDRVREAIAEGVEAGETVEQLAERVRGAFAFERGRSITIARTETAQSFSGGRYHAMLQAGIVFQDWLSSRDDRVRDSHVQLDGEVVAVGERFTNGLLFPGDPSGDAGEVVNCRCVAIPAAVRGTGEED